MIPAKVQPRLSEALKKFQPILKAAKAKDVNESDTVVIVTDILNDLFGYNKYTEITSEYAIKKTWCDLAIKIDNEVRFLIEVKAIGLPLKTDHIRQAVDYGANSGVDWIILTNGIHWKIYKVLFQRPIFHDLVYEFNLEDMAPKKSSDLELLFMVSKESLSKSVLDDYHSQKLALSKYFIANMLITDVLVDTLKKQIKKMNPDIKIENEMILEVLINEVIKRDTFDGDKSEEAKKRISKYYAKLEKEKVRKPPLTDEKMAE